MQQRTDALSGSSRQLASYEEALLALSSSNSALSLTAASAQQSARDAEHARKGEPTRACEGAHSSRR